MIFTSLLRRLLFVCATVAGCVCQVAEATSCVWKATSPSGGTVFLAGSVHALRGSDYPLPAAYQRAFDSSSRLAFETEPKSMEAVSKGLNKAGQYGKGDSLKNHVDPRTYAYLKRYFTLLGVPEQKFSTYRPWLIAAMLRRCRNKISIWAWSDFSRIKRRRPANRSRAWNRSRNT